MSKENELLNKIIDYYKNLFTKEDFEALEYYIPISKAGIEFYQKTIYIMNFFEKTTTSLSIFPILAESHMAYLDENLQNKEDFSFGELSKDNYFEILRGCYFSEEEHPGRYFLSFYVMALTSVVDQYLIELTKTLEISLTRLERNYGIQKKMKSLMKMIDAWEGFKDAKELIPELVTQFSMIVSKRHLAAHQKLDLEWLKELSNVIFKNQVRIHTTIQNDLVGILGLSDEEYMYEGYTDFIQFISMIRVIAEVFLSYIGFYDNFIFSNDVEDENTETV